jgi:hypothetical protein
VLPANQPSLPTAQRAGSSQHSTARAAAEGRVYRHPATAVDLTVRAADPGAMHADINAEKLGDPGGSRAGGFADFAGLRGAPPHPPTSTHRKPLGRQRRRTCAPRRTQIRSVRRGFRQRALSYPPGSPWHHRLSRCHQLPKLALLSAPLIWQLHLWYSPTYTPSHLVSYTAQRNAKRRPHGRQPRDRSP